MSSEDLPPPSSSHSSVLESGLELEAAENNQQLKQNLPRIHHMQRLDWSVLVLGFCLASATEIAIQSLQTKAQLPVLLHMVSMAMVVAFASIFMAKFVPSKFPNHAKALEYVGIFCAATAFFLAITVALPLCLKLVSWAIYILILLTIFVLHVLPFLRSSDIRNQ